MDILILKIGLFANLCGSHSKFHEPCSPHLSLKSKTLPLLILQREEYLHGLRLWPIWPHRHFG